MKRIKVTMVWWNGLKVRVIPPGRIIDARPDLIVGGRFFRFRTVPLMYEFITANPSSATAFLGHWHGGKV